MTLPKRPNYIADEGTSVPEGDDNSVPQIGIIQSISPERDDDSAKYIEGCRDGQLFNSTTRDVFEGKVGILVRVVHVMKQWVEWVPRNKGGGLVATYNSEDDARAKMEAGNDLQVSLSYFVLLSDDSLAVIRLATKSKMRVHREWAALIAETGNISGMIYRVKVVKEKNRQGQPYFNFLVVADRWLTAKENTATSELKKELVEALGSPVQKALSYGSSEDSEI